MKSKIVIFVLFLGGMGLRASNITIKDIVNETTDYIIDIPNGFIVEPQTTGHLNGNMILGTDIPGASKPFTIYRKSRGSDDPIKYTGKIVYNRDSQSSAGNPSVPAPRLEIRSSSDDTLVKYSDVIPQHGCPKGSPGGWYGAHAISIKFKVELTGTDPQRIDPKVTFDTPKAYCTKSIRWNKIDKDPGTLAPNGMTTNDAVQALQDGLAAFRVEDYEQAYLQHLRALSWCQSMGLNDNPECIHNLVTTNPSFNVEELECAQQVSLDACNSCNTTGMCRRDISKALQYCLSIAQFANTGRPRVNLYTVICNQCDWYRATYGCCEKPGYHVNMFKKCVRG